MSRSSLFLLRAGVPATIAAVLFACSTESTSGGTGGAATGAGGSAFGGVANQGGAATQGGGLTLGGAPSNGGASNGGMTQGEGGASKGGSVSNGGSANGGKNQGGVTSGGAVSASGGATLGGGGSKGGSPNAGGASGGTGSSGILKIMAVGDSITAATCWRAKLWSTLNSKHAGRFEMVGTLQSDNGCTPSNYDKDNQGYGSSLVTEAVANDTDNRTCQPKCPSLDADFAPAFMSQKPDIALLHYATNDVWNGKASADITNAWGKLVDALRAANPNVKVLVAKIIPMHVTATTCSGCTCSACASSIMALNSAVDAWASGKSTASSPILVVDQFTGFDADADTRDGVHPNDSGSQKMATKWADALEPLF